MKKIRKCAIMMAVMLGVLQLNMVAWAAEDEIPVVEQQDVELADGNYTISVDLEGGSGRARRRPSSAGVRGFGNCR